MSHCNTEPNINVLHLTQKIINKFTEQHCLSKWWGRRNAKKLLLGNSQLRCRKYQQIKFQAKPEQYFSVYLFIFVFMSICVHMCVCVCMCVWTCVLYQQKLCRPEEIVRYPRVGAVGYYEPPHVDTRNQTQVLWKRSKQL